jgi:hypothetical protein
MPEVGAMRKAAYRPCENPSGANSAECPPNDESRRVQGGSAEGGRGLKEQDAEKEDGLDGEESVEFVEQQLESERGQEIPAFDWGTSCPPIYHERDQIWETMPDIESMEIICPYGPTNSRFMSRFVSE